jgi:hypothetical protein
MNNNTGLNLLFYGSETSTEGLQEQLIATPKE